MFHPRSTGDTCTATYEAGADLDAVRAGLAKCGVRIDRILPELAVSDAATLRRFRFVAVTRHMRPKCVLSEPLVAGLLASLQLFAMNMRALDVQCVMDNTVSSAPVVKLGLLVVYIIGDAGATGPPATAAPAAEEDADGVPEGTPPKAVCDLPVLWQGTRRRHTRFLVSMREGVAGVVKPGTVFTKFADKLQANFNKHSEAAHGKSVVIGTTARVAMAAAMKYNNDITVPHVVDNSVVVSKASNIVVRTEYGSTSTPTVTTVSLDDARCIRSVLEPAAQSLLQRDGGCITDKVQWFLSGAEAPYPGFMVNVTLGGV